MMSVRHGKARLDVHFGIPCLQLYGSRREMGLQYGALLKDRIAGALDRTEGIKRALFSLFPFFLRPVVRVVFALKTFAAERKIPGDYLAELRGVSKGSGQSYRRLLFVSTIAETLIGFGCTSILNRTGNKLLHSRNLDFFPPFLGSIPLVVHYHPDGKKSCVLIGFVGYLPGLTGMNDDGLTLSLNESSCAVKPSGRNARLIGYTVRRILEEAGNLKEAGAILDEYGYSQGWTLTAGSVSENNGIVFDVTGQKSYRNFLQTDRCLYAVNTFKDDAVMKKYQSVTRAGHSINHARKAVLDKTARKIRNVASAIRVLSDTGFGRYPFVLGDSTVNNYRTLQTVIMDPAADKIVFSSASAYAGSAAYYAYGVRAGKLKKLRNVSGISPKKGTGKFVHWMESLYENPAAALKELFRKKELVPFQLEAALFLKDALRLNPGAEWWQNVLDHAEKLLVKHPDHTQLARWKGEALFHLKRFEAAAAVFQSALRMKPLSPNDEVHCLFFLAQCHCKLGRPEECTRSAGRALKIIGRFAAGPAEKKMIRQLKSQTKPLKME